MASSSAERLARITISISVRDEAIEHTNASISTVTVSESSKRVMTNNKASFSNSLSKSTSAEIGASAEGYGSFNVKDSHSLTTSAANSWGKISDVSSSDKEHKEFKSERTVDFVPGTIQIYAMKKTVIEIDGSVAEDNERIHLQSGREADIGTLLPGNPRYNKIRQFAWNSIMHMPPPDRDVIVFTVKLKQLTDPAEEKRKQFALVTWAASDSRAGTDRGSGASNDLSYYRPSGSYYSFGDAPGQFAVPAVRKNDLAAAIKFGVVAKNIGWTTVWTDKGSGNDNDYAVYLPIAPAGFVPLGVVCVFGTRGVRNPSHNVLCVSKHHPQLKKSGWGTWAWSDAGSGANQDLTLNRLEHGLLWPTKATLVGSDPWSLLKDAPLVSSKE